MCVWAFVLMCYECTGGFCVCTMHLCWLLCRTGIPAFVCVCVCMPLQTYLDACQALFPVYCSLFFTPLYLLFSEGSLQRAAKGSFHTVADRLLPHASLFPADYGEIKTCGSAPSKIHYVSDIAGRLCHRGCDK